MIGNKVEISFPPRRIVSLVPSQTELLAYLGLDEEVVGITKFCVHPHEWFRNKKRVGGTKTLHLDIIESLQPDLIIANKEENTREQVEELSAKFPVWVSDITTIDHALQMIAEIGQLTGREAQAITLIKDIRAGFDSLRAASVARRVAYYIWREPWMVAGGDTFVSDMIKTIGWENACAQLDRYPEVSPDRLRAMGADLVLLSSEPYPFKDKHIAEIQASLPGVEVCLVDGEFFSWYGSRMLKAVDYLAKLVQAHSQAI